jgi:hypothetical protein
MEVSGQLHVSAVLPRRKSRQYPSDRRLGGVQSPSGLYGVGKNSCHCLDWSPKRLARSSSLWRLRYPGVRRGNTIYVQSAIKWPQYNRLITSIYILKNQHIFALSEGTIFWIIKGSDNGLKYSRLLDDGRSPKSQQSRKLYSWIFNFRRSR